MCVGTMLLDSSNPDTQKSVQHLLGIGFACIALTVIADKVYAYLKRRKKA
jgi:hypothetical protein